MLTEDEQPVAADGSSQNHVRIDFVNWKRQCSKIRQGICNCILIKHAIGEFINACTPSFYCYAHVFREMRDLMELAYFRKTAENSALLRNVWSLLLADIVCINSIRVASRTSACAHRSASK